MLLLQTVYGDSWIWDIYSPTKPSTERYFNIVSVVSLTYVIKIFVVPSEKSYYRNWSAIKVMCGFPSSFLLFSPPTYTYFPLPGGIYI